MYQSVFFSLCPVLIFPMSPINLGAPSSSLQRCSGLHYTGRELHGQMSQARTNEMHKQIYPTCDWEAETESHWNQNISPLDAHCLACHIASVMIAFRRQSSIKSKSVFGLRGHPVITGERVGGEEEGCNRVFCLGEGVFPVARWVNSRHSEITLISR